jgi:hypothetical protein
MAVNLRKKYYGKKEVSKNNLAKVNKTEEGLFVELVN